MLSYEGNAGEGKSHTMNNLFFEGDEVFKTCSDQVAFLRNHELIEKT